MKIGDVLVQDPTQVHSKVRRFLEEKGIIDKSNKNLVEIFEELNVTRTDLYQVLEEALDKGEIAISADGGPCGKGLKQGVEDFRLKAWFLDEFFRDFPATKTWDVDKLMNLPHEIREIMRILFRVQPDAYFLKEEFDGIYPLLMGIKDLGGSIGRRKVLAILLLVEYLYSTSPECAENILNDSHTLTLCLPVVYPAMIEMYFPEFFGWTEFDHRDIFDLRKREDNENCLGVVKQ